MATPQMINFARIDDHRTPVPHRPLRDKHGKRMAMTPKQLRERARRSKLGMNSPEFEILYRPVTEWDADELAKGRPKDKNGTFSGLSPKWLTREVHEEAMTRFRQLIRDGMNANTNIAIETIRDIMTNDSTDEDGRPRIAAGVKLDAAKFLVDHALGKPKQRVETDISVRLQGMLASSIITPGMLPAAPNAKELASPRDEVIDAEWWEDE